MSVRALAQRTGFSPSFLSQVELARYELSAGDSVLVERANACWENRGRGRAEVLVVAVRLG